MSAKATFPDYSQLQTKAKIADLERLAETDLTRNEYVCGARMARLLSAAFRAYATSLSDKIWTTDPFLKKSKDNGRQFQLFLAAMFDLACNIEYVHSRLVNSKWIYCRREGQSKPTV